MDMAEIMSQDTAPFILKAFTKHCPNVITTFKILAKAPLSSGWAISAM